MKITCFKKSLINIFFTAAFVLTGSITAMAAQVHGNVDEICDDSISGWAWNADAPEESLTVAITISDSAGTVILEVATDYLSGKLTDSGVGCSSHEHHHECHGHSHKE